MLSRRGFTLIELLVVLSIVAIVAGGSLFIVDPARRMHTAHNATRWADVLSILSALKRYQAEHDGNLPSSGNAIDTIDGSVQIIGIAVGACDAVTCEGHTIATTNCGLDSLGTDLRPYLQDLPVDPVGGTPNDARYYVDVDPYGIVSVGACDEEGEDRGGSGLPPIIEVTQ